MGKLSEFNQESRINNGKENCDKNIKFKKNPVDTDDFEWNNNIEKNIENFVDFLLKDRADLCNRPSDEKSRSRSRIKSSSYQEQKNNV